MLRATWRCHSLHCCLTAELGQRPCPSAWLPLLICTSFYFPLFSLKSRPRLGSPNTITRQNSDTKFGITIPFNLCLELATPLCVLTVSVWSETVFKDRDQEHCWQKFLQWEIRLRLKDGVDVAPLTEPAWSIFWYFNICLSILILLIRRHTYFQLNYRIKPI